MQKIFNFKDSLKKGQKYELEFLELFKDKVEQLDGYIADFKILKNGKTIELKTDFHCPTKTLNFFMEKFSYDERPGGVFQAQEKNIDYFIYWFPITQEFYCFEVNKLVKWLNKNYENPYLLNIRNQNHITKGFLVKRIELDDIRLNIEEIL